MDDSNSFWGLIVPSPRAAVNPRKAVSGDLTDESNVVVWRQEAERFGAPNLGVGEDAVSEKKPPGSPPLAVIGPLVENSGDGSLRSRRQAGGIGIRSERRRRQTRWKATGPGERDLRRLVAESRALQRDAAERVHLLDSHFGQPKRRRENRNAKGNETITSDNRSPIVNSPFFHVLK